MPIWVVCLITLCVPLLYTLQSGFTKHLTKEPENGWDSITLNFATIGCYNSLLLIIGISHWVYHDDFSQKWFWVGFGGSIMSAIGVSSLMKSVSCGPIGPAFAISGVYPPILVIIEAFRNHEMITTIEIISIFFGMYGVLVMVIPNFFSKYCFCCIKRFQIEAE